VKQVGNALLDLCERLRSRAPEEDEPTPPPLEGEDLWRNLLARAGCPAKYQAVPSTLPLHADLKDWAGNPPFVVILGLVGRGKTWQATRLFGELRAAGWSGVWVDALEAVEQIRREMATVEDGRTLDRLCETPLLLLDDFLAERDTEFARDKLSFVLRRRHAHEKATIITTQSVDGKGVPSLAGIEVIEPRLASRLAEGRVVRIGGRDRRMASARP
jgi:DNA replication protein DnaC